ncbi:predicted protein [Naegleria gruberi]|uniref:Predicted protein n=1 Tax=Naegleria gruberi TaxID=5762 RepID=D2W047_NAEGR|nr:uncharacterized protein NAEGRDRAFT_74730 [Naegleria gruberi]EFC37512.1 predicted protein [Naegleria gruberi]|eukprot:XP_002670256.1 predicted protein [Naegleria gruberi strain NEG-M]
MYERNKAMLMQMFQTEEQYTQVINLLDIFEKWSLIDFSTVETMRKTFEEVDKDEEFIFDVVSTNWKVFNQCKDIPISKDQFMTLSTKPTRIASLSCFGRKGWERLFKQIRRLNPPVKKENLGSLQADTIIEETKDESLTDVKPPKEETSSSTQIYQAGPHVINYTHSDKEEEISAGELHETRHNRKYIANYFKKEMEIFLAKKMRGMLEIFQDEIKDDLGKVANNIGTSYELVFTQHLKDNHPNYKLNCGYGMAVDFTKIKKQERENWEKFMKIMVTKNFLTENEITLLSLDTNEVEFNFLMEDTVANFKIIDASISLFQKQAQLLKNLIQIERKLMAFNLTKGCAYLKEVWLYSPTEVNISRLETCCKIAKQHGFTLKHVESHVRARTFNTSKYRNKILMDN